MAHVRTTFRDVDHDGVTLVEGATSDQSRLPLPSAPVAFLKMCTLSAWARM